MLQEDLLNNPRTKGKFIARNVGSWVISRGIIIIDANNRVDNMLTYRIELAGNPNSCIIKINNQKFCALLDSGAQVSLINTKVYKSLKGLPKL